jgi:hypothetical protein
MRWRDLLIATLSVAVGVAFAMLVRPPKFDAIMKYNEPRLYVPMFMLMGVTLIAIIYRSSGKP